MPQMQAGRSAILAPGGNYGADGPLLMYARLAVHRRGGRTRPIVWELSGSPGTSQQRAQVASQVTSAIEEMTAATGTAPVVIGKSLGSLAAPVVADRGLAAVWFTPLLTDEPTMAALRRAMVQVSSGSPSMVCARGSWSRPGVSGASTRSSL